MKTYIKHLTDYRVQLKKKYFSVRSIELFKILFLPVRFIMNLMLITETKSVFLTYGPENIESTL